MNSNSAYKNQKIHAEEKYSPNHGSENHFLSDFSVPRIRTSCSLIVKSVQL